MTRRRLIPVVPAVLLLLVALAAWREIGKAGPGFNRSDHPIQIRLLAGRPIEQTFHVPSCPGLTTLSLALTTHDANEARVQISMLRAADEGAWTKTSAGQLEVRLDPKKTTNVSVPLGDSDIQRRRLKLRLELADQSQAAVTLLADPSSRDRVGQLLVGGWPSGEADLIFTLAPPRGDPRRPFLACALADAPGSLKRPVRFLSLLVLFCLSAAAGVGLLLTSPALARARALAVPLTIYAATVLLWLAITPPFEGADETTHYDYARYLALAHKLPTGPVKGFEHGQWFQHPPLYYGLSAALLSADAVDEPLPYRFNPKNLWFGKGNEALFHQHHGTSSSPHDAALVRLRLFSAVLGAAALIAIFFLLIAMGFSNVSSAFICGMVALVPQWSFMFATVANDTLATTLGAMTTALILCAPARVAEPRRALMIGALAGLAAVTKLSAAFLMPAAALAIVLVPGLARQARLKALALAASGAAVTGGWFYVRNLIVFGDPLASEIRMRFSAPGPIMSSWTDPVFYQLMPSMIFQTSWARLGWASVYPRTAEAWTVYVLISILIAALAALACWKAVRRTLSAPDRARVVVAVAGITFGFAALVLHSVSVYVLPFGRYLFPLWPSAIVLAALGLKGAGTMRGARMFGAIAFFMLAVEWLNVFLLAVRAFHFGS